MKRMKRQRVVIAVLALIACIFLVRSVVDRPPAGNWNPSDSISRAGGYEDEKSRVGKDRYPEAIAANNIRGRQPSQGAPPEWWLEGSVHFADGIPSSAGLVAAWPVGVEPSLSDYRNAAAPPQSPSPKSERVWMSAIHEDGSFSLAVPGIGGPFLLGAVIPGAVSRAMENPVHVGNKGIRLTMDYLYGVVIRIQDSRGGSVRTSEGLFGDGPTIKGFGGKSLQQIPRMLALLDIANLDVENQTRDRWTYLLLSEKRVERIGPIEYRIHVPGYEPEMATLYAYPVDERIVEQTVSVRVQAEAWGTLVVRTLASEGSLSSDLALEENVGSVVLFDEGKAVTSFALHMRGFLSDEEIIGIPSGRYSASFESREGYYRTPDVPLTIEPGRTTLDLDLQDAGALSLSITDEEGAYDGRLITSIVGPQGGIFHTSWERGPYCLPLLEAGTFRFASVLAPGRTVELSDDSAFTIDPGKRTECQLRSSDLSTER